MNAYTIAKCVFAGALLAAAPVSAQTYDAFSSFNGIAPQTGSENGGFVYGRRPTDPFAPAQRFTSNTNCTIQGSICLQENSAGGIPSLPGFYKGGSPSQQYTTILVPQDRLLMHTSQDVNTQVYAGFFVPVAGTYRVYGNFNVQDTNPTGVDVQFYTAVQNLVPASYTSVGSVGPNNMALSDFRLVTLNAGDVLGYAFTNGGSYFNDSVGVDFTVVAGVPEPATWGLMILGFGAIGGAMRRRRSVKASVRFA